MEASSSRPGLWAASRSSRRDVLEESAASSPLKYRAAQRRGVGRRCESGRRFLPWLTLILLWFLLGYRLHITWSEGVPGASRERWSDGDGDSDKNPSLALNDDDVEALAEHSRDGRVVGPFHDRASSARALACSTSGRFAEFVRRKSFVVVFHELSMTGAPLAIFELAAKLVACGGDVSAVVLNKRGGLLAALAQRGIAVVRDKYTASFKAASRADLVVASSASCHLWIEQYLRHNRRGGDRLVWWLMENRREYFERAKRLLEKPHALVFLSPTQERLWRQWAREDGVALASTVDVVTLSVSDALTNLTESERERLRGSVRREMGLQGDDYLVVSLSSINPGKGQLLMLQAASMVIEDGEAHVNLAQHDETGARIELREAKRRKDERRMKVLLGSVGSKSNKAEYLERIHEFVTKRPRLAERLLWTEATVQVAPLYAAADAYIMNAQGIGETFGRVTVEAMAFGLPVLGTDAGGTKEIVQENLTGLLHPVGQAGVPVLAQHLRWLLRNPEMGVEMGRRGSGRVQEVYREGSMYEALASVFIGCMQERGG